MGDVVRGGAPAPVPRWTRELLGVAAAIGIGLAVVAAVSSSPRSELLFRDGDSLVTTLIVHSIAAGQPQDWALSSVLFLPETAVLWLLSLLGLGVNSTLVLAGIVNIVALYGALRLAAGSPARGRAPIAGALTALTTYALLAASEWSPSRDALELASLLTTTTYYSATVLGTVLVVGIARRALDAGGVVGGARTGDSGVTTRGNGGPETAESDTRTPGASGLGTNGVPWGWVAGMGLVAAASVVTNPLFAAWATVPLVLVLGLAGWRARWLAGGLVAGTIIGFVGRMPLARLIANTGAGYADPTQWLASLDYYGALLAERWNAPWGAASVIAVVVLWGWCLAATVLLAHRRDVGAAVVAACGWVMPVVVVLGALALGTHAARYVQPAVFAPLLGLVIVPMLVPRLPVFRFGVAAVATLAVLAAALGLGIPRIAAAADAPDADLRCVVDWAERSGRIGGGQFWTVRLPKAHLADPRGLVQVDHRLRGYAWLVDRDDFTAGELSFLVMDAQSPAFELPAGVAMADADLVACGRYTIADFGERRLPIGPLRS
ncbi:hypothetical protein [Microbacterium timonense]|uniref:hypothetical protein n=1 Tax=Microbacterium timonense TaxID=2086576 RepID=UPI00190EB9F8|nr:hypothetical protein [Microbacterium timonense]